MNKKYLARKMRNFAEKLKTREFISLERDENSDYPSLCGSSAPSLYVSGVKDGSLMSMAKEGTATVRYKIRNRSVNERDDEPTYGADISISELVPVIQPATKKKDFFARLRVKNFADRSRNDGGQFISGAGLLGAGAVAAAVPGARRAMIGAGSSLLNRAGKLIIRG
jgi:hypothetical protein